MKYANQAMALAIVIATMGCVPNGAEPTALGASAPGRPVLLAAEDSAMPTADYRALEAKIQPSESDGQVFEYY